jgi:hypothetical protein
MRNEWRLLLLAAAAPATLALTALVLVAAGGVGAAPAAARDEGQVLVESEDRDSRIEVGPGCALTNGMLESRVVTQGSQRIYRSERAGAPAFGWQWSLPAGAPRVAGFPALVCGVQPFAGGAPMAGFPFAQGKRDLTVRYEAAVEAGGQHSLLFVLWVVSDPRPRKPPVSHEIQIHVVPMEPPAPGWYAEKLPPVTLDGVAWDVWRNPDGAGARKNTRVAPGTPTWPVLMFVAQRPMPRGPLHAARFLEHLVAAGLVPAGAWIADLELGTGYVQGEGWVRVSGFALEG